MPHNLTTRKDRGIPLSVLSKDTTIKIAGFFPFCAFVLNLKQEVVDTIFKKSLVCLSMGIKPMSTECKAKALTLHQDASYFQFKKITFFLLQRENEALSSEKLTLCQCFCAYLS